LDRLYPLIPVGFFEHTLRTMDGRVVHQDAEVRKLRDRFGDERFGCLSVRNVGCNCENLLRTLRKRSKFQPHVFKQLRIAGSEQYACAGADERFLPSRD